MEENSKHKTTASCVYVKSDFMKLHNLMKPQTCKTFGKDITC